MRSIRTVFALLASLVAVAAACRHHSAPATVDTLPTPAPAPSAQAVGCGLPPGGGSGEDCPRESPSFGDQVERAIDQAVAEHPEMVDTTRVRGCGNCYEVLDTHNFPEEVGRDLEKMGFYIRRDVLGSYRSTCYPAWF